MNLGPCIRRRLILIGVSMVCALSITRLKKKIDLGTRTEFPEESQKAVRAACDELRALRTARAPGEDDVDRSWRVIDEVERIVATISTVDGLELLIRRTRSEVTNQRAASEGDSSPFQYAAMIGLARLAKHRSDAAARSLVSMLADPRMKWDGESGEQISYAITACGECCLPYLNGFPQDSPRADKAEWLVEMIESKQIAE